MCGARSKPIAKHGAVATTLGTIQPFRYRGYVFEEETGLYYLRSRYYKAERERFLNLDLLFLDRNQKKVKNLFSYCHANAVNFCDQSGKDEYSDDGSGTEGWAFPGSYIYNDSISFGSSTYVNTNIFDATLTEEMIVAISTATAVTLANNANKNSSYTVYFLVDESNNIMYVGRTKNPIARQGAHKLNPIRRSLRFIIFATGLCYNEARGLEQELIERCMTLDRSNDAMNQIKGISINNDNQTVYYADTSLWHKKKREQSSK